MSVKNNPSFDELMKTIELRVSKLQDAQTSLEESLKLFEETSELIATAKRRLSEMEHTFETIQAKHAPDVPNEAGSDE